MFCPAKVEQRLPAVAEYARPVGLAPRPIRQVTRNTRPPQGFGRTLSGQTAVRPTGRVGRTRPPGPLRRPAGRVGSRLRTAPGPTCPHPACRSPAPPHRGHEEELTLLGTRARPRGPGSTPSIDSNRRTVRPLRPSPKPSPRRVNPRRPRPVGPSAPVSGAGGAPGRRFGPLMTRQLSGRWTARKSR
jgi:hypothetical protein